jgi:hypothetical protein
MGSLTLYQNDIMGMVEYEGGFYDENFVKVEC